jgi:hypothetical protein
MATAAPHLAALDQNKVTPGVLGFVVVAAIGVATWLLIRSMNKHMRRVDFEPASGAGGDQRASSGEVDGTQV